ncbi:laminin G domain protein [Necator americanus]|uniref:Laminin G domain protein n=1 Tax=Necator americanus TaxID=51031 RepID=W2TX99_NECAM|nr:laminin G domain protein [Necator americanus]ETN85657.1 laminin G domain protein [Necator americanus]
MTTRRPKIIKPYKPSVNITTPTPTVVTTVPVVTKASNVTETPTEVLTTTPEVVKEHVVETTMTAEPNRSAPVPDGACALRLDPIQYKDEVDGNRFGLQPNSRLEYEIVPDSFDKSGTFSLQLRPTASNGVIFFATNDKHTDHIGLFLLNGRVVLSFDTGAGQTVIRSNRSILTGEWHSVKASRRGNEGSLVVDDESAEAIEGLHSSKDRKQEHSQKKPKEANVVAD